MKYFGTDGIRGRVNTKNINGDMFFKFGLAAGKYFTNLKKKNKLRLLQKIPDSQDMHWNLLWYLD